MVLCMTGKVAISGNVRLVVYDITVTGIGTSHTTVSWKTNGNANSTVEYGPTTSVMDPSSPMES